jgi:hypothetical protein
MAVAGNAPPVVSLTSPQSGQAFTVGTPISLTANASDPDDLVARVEFRVNGASVASDTATPYSGSWTPGASGSFSVTAVAVDSDGAATTSTAAAISVGAISVPPPTGTGPWRLQFTPSVDHATITGYTMEIAVAATLALKVAKSLGKPAIGSDGTCIVDIDTLVSALPVGTYQVVVKAVGSTGTSASVGYIFSR